MWLTYSWTGKYKGCKTPHSSSGRGGGWTEHNTVAPCERKWRIFFDKKHPKLCYMDVKQLQKINNLKNEKWNKKGVNK